MDHIHAPAPVIVSTNHKGGVGKTTSSRVLAQSLAEMPEFTQGKPILVIDLDPQGNTSRRWQLLDAINEGPDEGSYMPKPHPALADTTPNYSSVCDLWLNLLDEGEALMPEPYETNNPMIHVVPAYERLMFEAIALPKTDRPKLGAAMRSWLRSKEIADKYSCVIVDTQPSKTPLIDAALMAATHVYVPFIPEPQAVDGVFSIVSYLYHQSKQRGLDVPLEILGLLPNLVQNTRLHNVQLKKLEKLGAHPVFGRYLMPVKLSRRIGYAETDDWESNPDQVTDLEGTNIQLEARKFARHIASRLEASTKVWGGRS